MVLLAAACWALAAWCSRGTLAVTSAAPDAARLGLLPSPARLAVLLAAAVIVSLLPAVRRLRIAPLFLSAFALLPWIPGAPVSFLLWTGPMTQVVWTAVFIGLLAAHDWRAVPVERFRVAAIARDPARAPLAAAAAAFALFSAAAWLVSPMQPGGDEPHYLLITQSLLNDSDLKIENNYRERQYESYFREGPLRPDFVKYGANGEIYSIHAPGLPVLVAPAFAIGGYPGVKLFLLLVSALNAALVWWLGYRVSGSAAAAWFGWAAVSLSTTSVFHASTVFPDGPGGLLVLTGVWALVRLDTRAETAPATRSLAWHGAALALLPWLHSRFALLAGVLGALIVVRVLQRFDRPSAVRRVAAFAIVPALSAAAWFGFFYAIYGTADPRAPYGGATDGRWDYVTSGLGGLFFDQQFGLLPYAPVLLPALIALVIMLRAPSTRRLSFEILLTLAPYLLSITHFRMWWAGRSAPARFFTPVLFTLAVPAALLWRRTTSAATKATLVVALSFTAFVTAGLVLVRGGYLAYNARDGSALWLEWLSRVASLPLGLPSFHRTPETTAYAHVAIWLACLAGAWLVLRTIEHAGLRSREVLSTAAPGVFAVAVMAALSIVWRVNGTSGLTPNAAQLELLKAAGAGAGFGVELDPPRRLDPGSVPARLALGPIPRYLESRDRPLFNMPELPAGRYTLRIETRPQPSGSVSIGIAPEGGLLREVSLSQADARQVFTVDVSVPVNVRAIAVWGDESARAAIARITLLPQSIAEPSRRATGARARRVSRYLSGLVYFFDDEVFPEPEAFWVCGRSETVFALDVSDRASLLLRNGPVPNRVTVESGSWREAIDLGPGEERTLDVPRAPERDATLVRLASASGFRPSEVNRASHDTRFLGVWVQPR